MGFMEDFIIDDPVIRVINKIKKAARITLIDQPRLKHGRCKDCGFRLRSKKHNEGVHHIKASVGSKRQCEVVKL